MAYTEVTAKSSRNRLVDCYREHMSLLTQFTKLKHFLLHNTSSKQTVIKNTFRLLLAEGISKGSLAVLIIMIGRLFGKEIFGQYSYLSVILTFLVVFADLGITQLTIRDYQHLDEIHRRQYLITGLKTKLLLSLLVTVIYIGILWFTAESSFLRLIGLILLTNNLTNSFLEYIRATFRSLQRGETELRIKLVQGVWNLLLIPLLYLYQSLPLNLAGQSLVTLITIGYARRLVHKRQLKEHTTEIITTKSQFIKNGWMFSMSALFVGLYYYVDSLIIQWYWGYEATGLYNAAYRILVILVLPVAMLWQSLAPTLRRLFVEDKKKYKKNLIYFILLALIGSSIIYPLIYFNAEQIIRLLYGSAFVDSYKILQILCSPLVLIYLYGIITVALQFSWLEKKLLQITICAFIINLMTNLIFIPTYGYIAAAYITACTEGFVLLSSWIVLYNGQFKHI